MAGYTPYGVPIYHEDAYGWDYGMGFPDSPTNIAERAAAVADLRCMEAVRMLERRLDMSGIQDMKRDTSVGDFKLGFNRMKAKLAGNPLPTVLSCFIALASFAGSVDVQKANLNDLGNDLVVTNVVLSGEFGHSATDLTEKVEFFNDIRDGKETGVKEAFSNAVAAVSSGGTSPVAQDFDARKLEHVDGFFDDLRTNRNAAATLSMSNAVVRFSPAGVPQDFDARKLENVDGFFDDVRTNKSPVARTSFSNAVDSVVSKIAPAPVHRSVSGKTSDVVVDSGGSTIVGVSESSNGLQRAMSANTIRVRDLTDIWIGGTDRGGKMKGGETAYGAMKSMISESVPNVTVTGSKSSGEYACTVNVGPNSYPIFVSNRTDVSVSPSLDSGVQIGSVSVDGVVKTLYAPSSAQRALSVGTDDAYVDSSLSVHSYSDINTTGWDVYSITTQTNTDFRTIPMSPLYTNIIATIVLTNRGSSVSPSYAWNQSDPSFFYNRHAPGSPLAMYEPWYVRLGIPKDYGLYMYGKFTAGGQPQSKVLIYDFNGYDDTAESKMIRYTFTDRETGSNMFYCAKFLAVRKSPAGVNEGRITSRLDADRMKNEILDIVGSGGSLRGTGVHSNAFLRYDGEARLSREELMTNAIRFVSKTRTDGGYENPSTRLYLVPYTVNSWTGSVYLAGTTNYVSSYTPYYDVTATKSESGLHVIARRPGYYTFESTGIESVFQDRLNIRMVAGNQYTTLIDYVVLYPDEATEPVSGNGVVLENTKVAFTNELSKVAFTGMLTATNEVSGGTVDIEPYTDDGTTVKWRIRQ